MKQYYYNKKSQRGLSLIELMISMVVGLFLLAGLVTNFVSTKNSDKSRIAVSEMDANASAAFELMRRTITHAGYASNTPIVNKQGFYTEDDGAIQAASCRNGSARESAANRAAINPTADIAFRDRITVISLADNPCLDGRLSCSNQVDVNPQAQVYYDCAGGGATRDTDTVACSTDPDVGMPNRSEAKIYSSFRLLRNRSSDDDRTLFCDGSRGGTQPIVDNVEAIQYLYGIREDNNSVTFKNSDTVTADNDWEKVRSVQVAMLMRSSNAFVLNQDSDKTFYSLLDTRVDIDSADLRRLFRVYTTTINLENMN